MSLDYSDKTFVVKVRYNNERTTASSIRKLIIEALDYDPIIGITINGITVMSGGQFIDEPE
jgi:hypothetical protein